MSQLSLEERVATLERDVLADWEVLPFDDAAADQLTVLRRQRVRIGTMDLRIAALALVHDATRITANRRDFSLVPKLRYEDWLAP